MTLSQPTPTITPEETTQTASSPTPNQPQSINVLMSSSEAKPPVPSASSRQVWNS
ncbi:MAG TPA: hypothetical protein VKA95_01635 [Nitrososphaeraceae archaeon]|nr:hypothetical protein [Nitrososphaeraceae archaeon]